MNFFLPNNIEEASEILKKYSDEAKIIAGSTWLMRAPIRDEELPKKMVSLSKIDNLRKITIKNKVLFIGSMVSHFQLYEFLKNKQNFECLKKSVIESANEGIRNAATIGGNICANEFSNSDIIPALLSLRANLIIFDGSKNFEMNLKDFLSWRLDRKNYQIVSFIKINEMKNFSCHKRFLLRESGDYPVVNLSVNLYNNESNIIKEISISVGVVENCAKNWEPFEKFLKGKKIDAESFKNQSKNFLNFFKSRDDIDCPGWYRLHVLPKLVKEAFLDISTQIRNFSS